MEILDGREEVQEMSTKGSDLTPQEQEAFVKLRGIIAEQLGVDEDEVTPDASFVEDLNADSLDLVELIMEIEEKFNVTVPDSVAETIVTVRDAITHILDEKM